MKITKLNINNVLSFKNSVDFEFNDDLNVFIGPNGSGKSNILSILINCIRGYFIIVYEIEKRGESRFISKKTNRLNMVSQFFQKNHYNNSEKFKIEMEITFNDSDKKNIKNIQEMKPVIKEYIRNNFPNDIEEYIQVIDRISNIELESVVNKKIICSIEKDFPNETIVRSKIDNKDLNYFEYIYYIDAFYLLSKEINELDINSPFLYFKTNRVPYNGAPNRITLSHTLQHGSFRTQNNDLNDNSYYINQCLSFLAEKDLLYKHDLKRNISLIEDDDYKKIKRYLYEYGFQIDIKCINIYNNEYAFIIKNLDDENGIEKDINELSSGEKEILNILFGIISENVRDGILIIDEPELHLHYLWQKKLSNILIQVSQQKNIQIFYSTHSSSLINSDNFNKIFRFYIDQNKSSNYVRLSSFNGNKFKLKDRFLLINATNNEVILFAKNIVLVEGITDKIVFEKIFSSIDENYQNNFEILATNGKGNFPKFQEILEELKIKYCIIADFDYIDQLGKGKINSYISFKGSNLDTNRLMKKNNIDAKRLFNSIEEYFIEERPEKKIEVIDIIKYIRTKYAKPTDFDSYAKDEIKEFIEEQKEKNLYILKGEIEDYYSGIISINKDINEVLTLCSEKFEQWKETDDYKELEKIANSIIKTFK
jgi:putative ATP-dependent endonuclease of the OLD family